MDELGKISKKNRSYVQGQAVGLDLRTLVVTLVIESGGNTETGHVPLGILSCVGKFCC